MIRRTVVAGVLLLAAMSPAAQAATRTLTSTAYGAVDFGDQVAYRVAGNGCESARPQVVVTAAGIDVTGPVSQPRADGVDTSGCAGAATVPSWNAVRAAGWHQGA